MCAYRIEKVDVQQLSVLQALGRQTFCETFAAVNKASDMENYVAESFSAARLKAELENPDSRFYMAYEGERPVGYLKVNFAGAQTELHDPRAMEIERIYVLNDFHGRQVAQALYGKALEEATQAGAAYIWLGVWEKNPRAIAFYRKNGFSPFGTHIFRLGADEQTDVLMRKEL